MKNSIVFLNGEYFGLYILQEKVDDNYIENNYLIPHNDVAMSKIGETKEGPEEEWEKLIEFFDKYIKKIYRIKNYMKK